MRAQAFNHANVFPRDPTAKPLHLGTARSSQGAFCSSMANGQAGRYVPVPVVPEVLRAKVRVFAELFRKTRE
jgi:hypothetical protein